MSKIRIKNFGPIREGYLEDDGWMDIKKVTVFIGDQGSGKSSVAKLFSSFTWFEKALNRGDFNAGSVAEDILELLGYQGIRNYLSGKTEVSFAGDTFNIHYNQQNGTIISRSGSAKFIVPKIMYVPAERNFLSTIKSAYDVKGLPGPLTTFAEELKRANIDLDGVKIDLPIRDYSYRYDYIKDVSYIHGPDYTLNLLEASSGLQSLVPLYLVSKNLVDAIAYSDDRLRPNISVNQTIRMEQELNRINQHPGFNEEEKEARRVTVRAKFYNKCFINIVEEPEQNLFPTSQRHMLNSLLEFNNVTEGNKLVMATHSPYIINYITLAIKAGMVYEKADATKKNDELKPKIEAIVPEKSIIKPADLVVYELDGDGRIIKLDSYRGMPSDENYLNERLGETNDLFSQLLDIEELCR